MIIFGASVVDCRLRLELVLFIGAAMLSLYSQPPGPVLPHPNCYYYDAHDNIIVATQKCAR